MRRTTLTFLLLFAFLAILFSLDVQQGLLHSGGAATAKKLFESLLQPDLSPSLLQLAFTATLQTFAYALLSISIALVFAFVLALFASGVLFQAVWLQVAARAVIGFLRAIHELVWAWFFVAAVGLNPVGAVFALAIPYSGYLGKIFADTLQNVPNEPITALRQSGATPVQCLCYGYLPQALPTMLSYTMYRLECAVRSSSVLSFVGLGGIGMQLQIALQDLKYEQVWVFLFCLVGLMVAIDRWSYAVRQALNQQRRANLAVIRFSGWAVALLMLLAWGYVLNSQPDAVSGLFQAENGTYLLEFLAALLGVGESLPAYLNPALWQKALWLSAETFVMSWLAVGFAALAMLIFVLPAAKISLFQGYFAPLRYISRGLFLVSRAVPELMWAMILVFIFKAGVLTGALALAIHNFGVLGKLCAEVIEDLDQKPLQHLRQNGASKIQLLFYGVFPAVMPAFLNYILYRFENIIRATLIVGFVGAGGLGMEFKLAMSFFHYSDITLYLLCYLLLVYLTDLLSAWAKRWVK